MAFIGAVPGADLIHGWSGISFSSPFAELAVSANLTWLSWVLYADAIASPAGSALAFTAAAGRESYAMGKNGFLPRAAAKVDRASGIPRRALVINFVLGLAFLLPLHSWQSIVAATSELALIAYGLPSISSIAFRRIGAVHQTVRGMPVLAPAAFVLASLILYWATWKELRIAFRCCWSALSCTASSSSPRRRLVRRAGRAVAGGLPGRDPGHVGGRQPVTSAART